MTAYAPAEYPRACGAAHTADLPDPRSQGLGPVAENNKIRLLEQTGLILRSTTKLLNS